MAEIRGRDTESLAAVILAAGQGIRMRSSLVKVLHPLAGRPMIRHVVDAVRRVGAQRIVCVVGYQANHVMDALVDTPGIEFALQKEPLGTGHALHSAAPMLDAFAGSALVCCGDTPLLTEETLRDVVAFHRSHGAPCTLLTAEPEDPSGYGRVITDRRGRIRRIVEEVDADEEIREIRTINTGVYCFDWPAVRPLLQQVAPENAQGEWYLTDVLELLAGARSPGRAVPLADPGELMGVNDRAQLAEAEGVLRERIRYRLMAAGVTFLAPETTVIDSDVEIGPDTILYPGVVIEGPSSVGRESVIGPFTRIVDSHVGRGVELQGWNYLAHTTVPDGSIVKPYVRQGSE